MRDVKKETSPRPLAQAHGAAMARRYLHEEGEVGGTDGQGWFCKPWEVALK